MILVNLNQSALVMAHDLPHIDAVDLLGDVLGVRFDRGTGVDRLLGHVRPYVTVVDDLGLANEGGQWIDEDLDHVHRVQDWKAVAAEAGIREEIETDPRIEIAGTAEIKVLNAIGVTIETDGETGISIVRGVKTVNVVENVIEAVNRIAKINIEARRIADALGRVLNPNTVARRMDRRKNWKSKMKISPRREVILVAMANR